MGRAISIIAIERKEEFAFSMEAGIQVRSISWTKGKAKPAQQEQVQKGVQTS